MAANEEPRKTEERCEEQNRQGAGGATFGGNSKERLRPREQEREQVRGVFWLSRLPRDATYMYIYMSKNHSVR
jgi:hypothetical protein